MRTSQSPILLTTIITILVLTTLTSQTYNNNLFNFPTSLAHIGTGPFGHAYIYPNGTAINHGASSSHDPFPNLSLAPGYTVHQLGSILLTQFVPILFSTAVFETFYHTIFQRAAAEFWAQAKPSKRLTISIGQLHLSLETQGDPIPWAVIATFAWNMWNAAKRGWTAGYALQIVGPEGDETIVVLSASVQGGGVHVEQDFVSEGGSEAESGGSNWREWGDEAEGADRVWREPELVAEGTLSDTDGEGQGSSGCKRFCRRPPQTRRSVGGS